MNSESVASKLSALLAMSRPPTSSHNLLGASSGTPQEGSFSSYDGSSQLFYENYGDEKFPTAGYGSSWRNTDRNAPLSCCPWSTNDPSISPHSSYVFAGVNTSSTPRNVVFNAHPPPPPPPLKSTLVRDLPAADPRTDYMERISPISGEDPLSPLSLYREQLPLDPLQQGLYLTSMTTPRKWAQDRPHHTQPDDDHDDDRMSPERRPYHPLHDLHRQGLDKWAMSPDSMDTDLDDESVLSSSTSSLSPPLSESDLRHFVDLDEDDYDDACFSHSVSMPGCSFCDLSIPVQSKIDPYFFSTTPASPPNSPHLKPMNELYHPIEQYPSHEKHLYNPTEQQCQQQQHQNPQTVLPCHPSGDTQHHPSPSSLFSQSEQMMEDLPTTSTFQLPCSPSLRRPVGLPPLEDELFFGQSLPNSYDEQDHSDLFREPPRRSQWLSLPGADTDDDLIPLDLASKSYIPDPTIAIPSSHNGNLLIWGPASPGHRSLDYIQDDEPRPPRSPSPENLRLDPATISELAPEGEVEEAQRLYELRQKTPKQDKWQREKCRELSALLKLKLKLPEREESSSGSGEEEEGEKKMTEEEADAEGNNSVKGKGKAKDEGEPSLVSPFSLSSSSPPALPAGTTRRSKSLPTPASSSPIVDPSTQRGKASSKPAKITSMDQLVAKMVFHRQQDSPKRPPTKTRHNILPRSQQTPHSPLRQVSLPHDCEEEEQEQDVDVVDDGSDTMRHMTSNSPPPISSPLLCASPLAMSMELDPILGHSNRSRMTI